MMTHEEETENFLGNTLECYRCGCRDGSILTCPCECHDPLPHDEPHDWDDCDDDCGECGGDGWILDDCFEDTCCCLDPEEEHGWIPCPMCNPEGKVYP